MTCARWEERLALWVEGDLPAREADAVEAHLASCAGCREFQVALVASQGAVKALGAEQVDGAVLDAVRSRVMARAARQPARGAFAWWDVAVPLAFAAALAVAILWPREVLPPAAVAAVIPPAPASPHIVWAKHEPRPRPKPAAHVARATPPSEPLLMRIVTGDPNVVIYWIVEGKKGD